MNDTFQRIVGNMTVSEALSAMNLGYISRETLKSLQNPEAVFETPPPSLWQGMDSKPPSTIGVYILPGVHKLGRKKLPV